jgi:hypothetical protein
MNKFIVYTNFQQRIVANMQIDSASFVIDSGATVTATLYQGDCAETLPINVLEAEDGSDWSASKVVAVFPVVEMDKLAVNKPAEMQITISGDPVAINNNKWTFQGFLVKKGY